MCFFCCIDMIADDSCWEKTLGLTWRHKCWQKDTWGSLKTYWSSSTCLCFIHRVGLLIWRSFAFSCTCNNLKNEIGRPNKFLVCLSHVISSLQHRQGCPNETLSPIIILHCYISPPSFVVPYYIYSLYKLYPTNLPAPAASSMSSIQELTNDLLSIDLTNELHDPIDTNFFPIIRSFQHYCTWL